MERVYKAKILRVVDGDTVDVDIDLGFGLTSNKKRIRLLGIDTPEKRTRDLTEKYYGKLATAFLESHLEVGKKYKLRTSKPDKYGRILGEFFIKDTNINQLLVEENHAVAYYGQSKDDVEEGHLANRRRLAQRGLHPK
jgi:micrococcal nuclease|tara:strand:+ start:388 stop:801 length:414 start_codon:yes stop_codon:yes gene_type:complete